MRYRRRRRRTYGRRRRSYGRRRFTRRARLRRQARLTGQRF